MDEEKDEVRKAALEFMISLSEAKPSMVKQVDGWTAAVVRGCLEGMGELRDDDLGVWLEADVCEIFNLSLKSIVLPIPGTSLSRLKTPRTTVIHMYTNNRWIDSPVPLAVNRFYHLRSSIYLVCLRAMIGDCDMRA